MIADPDNVIKQIYNELKIERPSKRTKQEGVKSEGTSNSMIKNERPISIISHPRNYPDVAGDDSDTIDLISPDSFSPHTSGHSSQSSAQRPVETSARLASTSHNHVYDLDNEPPPLEPDDDELPDEIDEDLQALQMAGIL